MKVILQVLLITTLWCLPHVYINGQSVLEEEVSVETGKFQIEKILQELERKNNIIFSYNPNTIALQRLVNIKNNKVVLENLLDQLFLGQSIQYKAIKNRILLLPKLIEFIRLSGYIYNQETDEILPNALVIDNISQKNVYADDQGYYKIEVVKGPVSVSVNYLGNIKSTQQMILEEDKVLDFFLPYDTNLDSVVILTRRENLFIDNKNSGDNIINYLIKNFQGKLGQSEIFENARMMTGVQSGNEAQGGLYVRGGTADQNLILMDGIALYDASHIGGLSSIFMDDMIRNVNLLKNGIPARYGGRLSSVLDVKLKDGSLKKNTTIFDIGLDAMHLHMDGPLIKNKLSFNFSLRKSILNSLVSSLFSYERGFDDLDLDYYDANFKLVYRINENQKLSMVTYAGRDKIGIYRDSTASSIIDNSKINWGTSLIGLNYQNKISQKTFLQLYLNTVNYSRLSRGEYQFLVPPTDTISPRELDMLVSSEISDMTLRIELNHRLNKSNLLRFGGNVIKHDFTPLIYKSDELSLEDQFADSTRFSNEFSLYLEDEINIKEVLDINLGLHWNQYIVGNTKYQSLQPRAAVKWLPAKGLNISATFNKMSQNIHFLTNPGLGIPSELWVPSSESIKPQEVIQYGIGGSWVSDDLWKIGMDFYIKEYSNILEFDNPTELFYAFLLNESSVQFNGLIDWENHLEVGKAKVKSAEFFVFKKWKDFVFWGKYNWSSHWRTFENLNDGKPFLSKYDRTHDINLKTTFNYSNRWSFSASWIYGSGNTYTLPLEEYSLPDGSTVIVSTGRNNIRFPAFHHLDISAKYKKVFERYSININMGVYNVYNRFNPFYIYLYEDEKTNQIKRRGVSLFPIVPFINVRFRI